MSSDDIIRQHLLQLLQGGNAHLTLDQAIEGFPPQAINSCPPNVTYSSWHLLEHIRIAQSDILEFVRDPEHVSPAWPEGYWPPEGEQADEPRWQRTIQALRSDMEALEALVLNPATDLYADLPHAPGYSILREILLVADHNAYHLGEFAILRQIMGTWGKV
ncbi:DinB family protein [Chloroflexota bacterium]